MAVSLTPRRAVLLVAGVFLGLGGVQAYAAVAVPESSQLAVIRWSAVGMLLLLGLVVMLLRGMITVGADEEGTDDTPEAGEADGGE
jgi:Zn-dependent alcohol dehydrogenase